MTKKHRFIVWAALFACLALMLPGLLLRVGNENNNRSVVVIADYNEFYRASLKGYLDFDEVLQRLKDSGVKTIAIKEVGLKDLCDYGEVHISTVGEYMAAGMKDAPGAFDRVSEFVGGEGKNPFSKLVITSRKDTAAFLKEGLEKRLGPDEYAVLEVGEESFFLIKTEIDEENKVGLGFRKDMLDDIKKMGFEIVLRPSDSPGQNNDYLEEYGRLVDDYNIQYIIFEGSRVAGFPDGLEETESLVKRSGLIVGIIESYTQIGYIEQEGLEQLMENTGYPINRVYSEPDYYLTSEDGEELFYHWIRGVVDRNIRFIYTNPLKNHKKTYRENVNDTIDSIGKFTGFIATKGYAVGNPIMKLSGRMSSQLHYLFVALSLIAAGILYLSFLFEHRISALALGVLAALGVVLSAAMLFGINMALEKPLALGAAILYPSFSTLLLLRYLKENIGKRGFWKNAGISLAILIGIDAIGMYTVVSTLSDIRYIMNVELYRGVLVSFAIPVIMFIINFIFVFAGYGRVQGYLTRIASSYVTYLAVAIGAVGAVAFYVYILRSGNRGMSVLSIELKIREVFEKTMLVRPRLKEYLIGYPALFALVYLYNRYKKEIIPFILGIGAAVGSVSMVNSFCHVFTEVYVSVLRTFYGLVFGACISAVVVVVLHFALNIFESRRVADINNIE